jgi:hypothetical protein
MPTAPAFRMPGKHRMFDVFKLDIADAGVAYRNEDGLVCDLHCLIHTFISNLARSGDHPKFAQSLARHSTITLTMDRYSHTLIGEQADALMGLPDLTGPLVNKVGKTGTDNQTAPNHLADCLLFSERQEYDNVDVCGLSDRNKDDDEKDGKPLENKAIPSGGGGIRTRERLAASPVFKTGAINHSATPPGAPFFIAIDPVTGRGHSLSL